MTGTAAYEILFTGYENGILGCERERNGSMDPDTIDFFTDQAVVGDPYPYLRALRSGRRSPANRTTA